MILQELAHYYERKQSVDVQSVAPLGWEYKEIPFVLVLHPDGSFHALEDMREADGKWLRGRKFLVPQAVKKSSNVSANLLWGSPDYVFGLAEGKRAEKPQRLSDQRAAFLSRIQVLAQTHPSPDFHAVIQFLSLNQWPEVQAHALFPEILQANSNLSFRIAGHNELVCQNAACREAVDAKSADHSAGIRCLISGESAPLARLHPPIKGVFGAQSSGASIVSFNLDAFNSYGKSQGANAPVGEDAAFSYTTALNNLLARESRNKLQVGDTSIVFWAEKSDGMEDIFADLFSEPARDDPDRGVRAVAALYAAPNSGALPFVDDKTRFFVLGLAPNAARISIRFWYVVTVADLAENARQYFMDIDIVRHPRDLRYPPLSRLLSALAVQGKSENIPPSLSGDFMRAILADAPLPESLLRQVLLRIRAESSAKRDFKDVVRAHDRAALLKAYLNRRFRQSQFNGFREVTVALDLSNNDPGYRLGRLFSVLEKIQEDANPDLKVTIRDRYYGAASSTPVTVFPVLLRLKNHHLGKLENRGQQINYEKRIGEIMAGLPAARMPANLSLPEQAMFALGYYHQRQSFFTKKDAVQNSIQEEGD